MSTLTPTLAFIQNLNPFEWVIILVVMLLLFGRRLPEVGKSLGKGIVEFKKGLKGVEDEVESASNQPARQPQQQWQPQPPANLPPAAPVQPMPPIGQPGTVSRADMTQPS